jgi:serine/threonine protein kinase
VRYERGELIGEGGMARVYRGRHSGLDRPVAIKELREGLTKMPELTERFLREARICARLDHPCIVRVYDTDIEEGRPYIVMELLEGETLQSVLRRQGPLTDLQAVYIAKKLLSALSYAHGQGVIHQDIKPGNIFVGRQGMVKLVDFGIAAAAGAGGKAGGAQFGTLHYMSPEQLSSRPIDARSDIYSLGVVLYELVAGQPPFRAVSPLELRHQQMVQPPPPLPDSVPVWLQEVIEKALQKDPNARFQSADEMLQALEKKRQTSAPLSDGIPVANRTVTYTSYQDAIHAAVEARRRQMKATVIAIVLVLLALGGVWGYRYYQQSQIMAEAARPPDIKKKPPKDNKPSKSSQPSAATTRASSPSRSAPARSAAARSDGASKPSSSQTDAQTRDLSDSSRSRQEQTPPSDPEPTSRSDPSNETDAESESDTPAETP